MLAREVLHLPVGRKQDHASLLTIDSNGGAPTHPVWYRNIVANPLVELQDGAVKQELRRQAPLLADIAVRLGDALIRGNKLMLFGNGGSATDAQQLATLFLNPGGEARPLPAFGLANDTSVVTALCNDIGVEVVFARQLAAFGGRNDIAVGLSTSGNSGNLLRAFDEASRRGMLTIGLAGYDGGKMAELDSIDYLFVVPSSSVHRIQEAQTTTYQVLWELTQEEVSHVPRHTR